MSLARVGRLLSTTGASKSRTLAGNFCDSRLFDTAGQIQQFRQMSGANHGRGLTHEGLTLYPPATWQKVAGEGLAGLMWFWILFRAYHDGNTFLYGHAPHFEHDEHSKKGEDHSH